MDADMGNRTGDQTEARMSLRDVLPEVAIIAFLLVLGNIMEAIRAPVNLWVFFQYRDHMPFGLSVMKEAVLWPLALGGIVAGIGLLTYARWARRLALIVAYGFVIAHLLIPFISGRPVAVVFQQPLFLFLAAQYAAMCYILSTPRVRALWAEDGPPSALTVLALERSLQQSAKALLPALLFIALYLLCRAGMHLAAWQPVFLNLQALFVAGFYSAQHLYLLPAFGYLAAGIAILCRAGWGRYLAILVLITGFVIQVIPYFQTPGFARAISLGGFSVLLVTIVSVLVSLATTMVLISFLLRPEPRVTEPLFE